jgi:hypothetical protein
VKYKKKQIAIGRYGSIGPIITITGMKERMKFIYYLLGITNQWLISDYPNTSGAIRNR